MAFKKFRANAKGLLKRKQAFKSHHTAKKTPKRRRQLRGFKLLDKADRGALKVFLPYLRRK